MPEIQTFPGRFHELSSEGWIKNDCTLDHPPEWDGPIMMAVNEVKERLGSTWHSTYLRGSLARGTSILGVSDLDMLVVHNLESKQNWDWANALKHELTARFPFCRDLDINFLSKRILEESEAGAAYRFMLKTQSICIAGEDIIKQLPEFRPERSVMFSLTELNEDIDKAARGLQIEGRALEFCSWIMRRVVRSAGELAMLRDGRFTRDLGLCVQNYLLHFSNNSTPSIVREALNLALNPSSDDKIVMAVARKSSEEFTSCLANLDLDLP